MWTPVGNRCWRDGAANQCCCFRCCSPGFTARCGRFRGFSAHACWHRLTAIVVPFVGYQTIWTLFMGSRYCPLLYLTADYAVLPSIGFVLSMQALYLSVFLILSYAGMKWRCRYA